MIVLLITALCAFCFADAVVMPEEYELMEELRDETD